MAGSVTCLPRQLPGSSARLEADATASTRRGQARLRRLETLGCSVVPPTAWPHKPWQRRNAVSVPLTVTGAVTGPMAPAQGGCSLGAEFDRGIPLSDSGTTQGRSQRSRTAGRALEVSVAEGRAARGLGTVWRGAVGREACPGAPSGRGLRPSSGDTVEDGRGPSLQRWLAPAQEDASWWQGVLDTTRLHRLMVISLHSRTACRYLAHLTTDADACLLRRGRDRAQGSR